MTSRPARDRPIGSIPRGFSFLEILMVMAMIAVLAGLGIGFMQNLGQGTRLLQARSIVLDSAFACKSSSNGGTRATFSMRQSTPTEGEFGSRVYVEALAARPVLTAQFETIDVVSQGFPVRTQGAAQIDPDLTQGWNGHALKLERGGYLELPAQPSFAMTEGIAIDVHVRTEGGPGSMTVLQGVDPDDDKNVVYALSLLRAGEGASYDVRLSLQLRLRPEAVSTGIRTDFTTTGGPVRADGTWQHLEARFDGRDASIRVNDLERLLPASAPKATRPTAGPAAVTPEGTPSTAREADAAKRLVVPRAGAVRLMVAAPTSPFQGWIDALVLGGMFRSSEWSRELFADLEVKQPKLPIRAEFVNGRLDPTYHRAPIVIVIADRAKPQSIPWTITIGLDGEITAAEGDVPKTETP